MMQLSSGVSKIILDNGLTVLLKENHAWPVVAIATYVKAGYFNESDAVIGISHLIEHMFFKGTSKRGVGEIAQATKELGGYLNASTIYDHTLYYTVLPGNHLAEGLELQSDALINSAFDATELKKETEVVIQEAKRKLDTPSAYAKEKFFELAFDTHRIRRWRIGTEEGLRKLTRDDFITFHKNLYRPENIILSVVGDFESKYALQEIKKFYNDFPKSELIKEESQDEPPQTEFKYQFLQGSIQQSYINIGFHTPDVFNADSYALDVVTFILGKGRSSRLFESVKEKANLVHSISVSNYALRELGIFSIDAVTDDFKIREAESAIFAELAKIRCDGVNKDELKKTKNILESIYVASLESVSAQAQILASYEALGDYRLVEVYMKNIFQVSEEDIVRVARKYLRLENCSLQEYVPESSKLQASSPTDLKSKFTGLLGESFESSAEKKVKEITKSFVFSSRSSQEPKRLFQTTLSNGLGLIVKENHQLPLASVGLFARGGRSIEKIENCGITELTVRSLLKGTKNRTASEIATGIEDLGSGIHLTHTADTISCTMNILSKNLPKGLEIFSDVVTNPIFANDEVKKEKDNIFAKIGRMKDDMFAYPMQLFFAALFRKHPYGLPAHGLSEAIEILSQENLVNWHRDHFNSKNLLLVAAGDVDSKEFENMAEDHFGGFPKSSHLTPTSEIEIISAIESNCETLDKEQTALTLGFPGPSYTNEDYYSLIVLQNILSGLGGRFFEELRSRQSLAYTVYAFLVSRLLGGTFVSYIATSHDKEEQAKAGLLEGFEKLTQQHVSEEELKRAIQYTVGTHRIGLESNGSQMVQYAYNVLLGKGLDEIENFPKKIKNVTQQDIMKAAQKYFQLDCYAEGIVRGKTNSR